MTAKARGERLGGWAASCVIEAAPPCQAFWSADWLHAHLNLKGGPMHAEPVEFVLGEGAGPFRLVIASQGGNCPHYRGGRNGRQ